MYIIDNNEIKNVECVTLGMSTGLDLSEFNWIRNRINNCGIFYFDKVTYYKYYSVASYLLKNPHLQKLNNINSIISYINSIHSARFISNFTADSTKLRETMSSVVVNLSRNILMVLGLVGYLLWVDFKLAMIFLVVRSGIP